MNRMPAWLVCLAIVTGCVGGSTATGVPSAETAMIELAAADRPRLTGTADDARAGAAASNAFGLDVYRALVASAPDANLVMSPSSVALALAMARAGARGATADEIDRVLYDLGTDDHAAWVAALDAALAARTGRFTDRAGEEREVTLRVVNAPFGQRGFTLEQAYLDALSARFDAGLRLVDYVAAAEAARGEINAWVAEQTEDRITDLLSPGDVDELTRLVLVNAIYLKAAWLAPFQPEATRAEPFRRPDGSAVDVQMMHADERLPYAAGPGWRAVELGYVGDTLAMLVVVPDDLAGFEASLSAGELDGIVGALTGTQVMLGFPRFGIESKAELTPVLQSLGMPTAFGDDADFSGVTSEERLRISAVVHQANIDVDETGTEAAAATAVAMRVTSLPIDPVSLTVDRPFLFALRDRDTGAVLFLGRVTEPADRDG